MMIGQDKLKQFISTFTAESFPKSVLIVGEQGCGKHTLVNNYILPMLDVTMEDITESISFDKLLDIALDIQSKAYLIDIDKLSPQVSEKQQNVILKFVEEPPVNVHIILLTTNLVNILQTIQNRCTKLVFESYTDEQLLTFNSDKSLIKYIRTPGKLLTTTTKTITEIEDICNKLFLYKDKASLGNMFTIVDKFNWSGKDQGYDKDIFFDILIKICFEMVKQNQISSNVYKLTSEYVNKFKSKIQFDRKRMFEKYLVELKYGC